MKKLGTTNCQAWGHISHNFKHFMNGTFSYKNLLKQK